MGSTMAVCKRVHYSGRVQGVGFRYTAQRLAKDFAVSGYVRNLPSGDVEVVAEGEAGPIDAYLAAIARQMAEFIDRSTVQDMEGGGLKGFAIRY
jgi:acylphosphatase